MSQWSHNTILDLYVLNVAYASNWAFYFLIVSLIVSLVTEGNGFACNIESDYNNKRRYYQCETADVLKL